MRHISKILFATLALLVSGCSGIEIGGKAWIQKIDESQSSQRTYAQPPLKCLFVHCGQTNVEEAVK